jgi:endonuclease/exonuclease/phosphatase family metal-dependent hydrolase
VPADRCDQEVTVASYNVHAAIGRDGRCDPHRILDVIGRTGAAIVGIQEVDARVRPEQPFDQFEFFCDNAGMACIAGPNIVEHRGRYGNVLLTRLPIDKTRLIKFPAGRGEPRGAIIAILQLGRHRLQVLNTHLGLTRSARRRQARTLFSAVADHDGPTLFLGDFNVWHPRSYVLNMLGAPAGRTLAPPTFPSGRPVLALDRAWTRPVSMLRRVSVMQDRLTMVASDHLPVIASIALPE